MNLTEAENWFERHLPGHHETSAAPATASVTIKPTTPGGPVSLLTEAKTILHDGLQRLEAVDEAALGVVDAAKVNPTAVSIINTLASVAHLPDPQGLLAAADNTLKAFAAILQQGAQNTAPAGPTVAGQA